MLECSKDQEISEEPEEVVSKTIIPKRIVYVDDEDDLRTLMRQAFEAFEYDGSFVSCASGRELLDRLKMLRPELIILDVRMPTPDGLETIELLRKTAEGKDVPVIFMTGIQKLNMAEDYKNLGVIGVLHKPLNLETLIDQINEIWSAHEGEAE